MCVNLPWHGCNSFPATWLVRCGAMLVIVGCLCWMWKQGSTLYRPCLKFLLRKSYIAIIILIILSASPKCSPHWFCSPFLAPPLWWSWRWLESSPETPSSRSHWLCSADSPEWRCSSSSAWYCYTLGPAPAAHAHICRHTHTGTHNSQLSIQCTRLKYIPDLKQEHNVTNHTCRQTKGW